MTKRRMCVEASNNESDKVVSVIIGYFTTRVIIIVVKSIFESLFKSVRKTTRASLNLILNDLYELIGEYVQSYS